MDLDREGKRDFAGRERGLPDPHEGKARELVYSAGFDFPDLNKTPIKPRLVSGVGLELEVEPDAWIL
jgi:hypothetical protein